MKEPVIKVSDVSRLLVNLRKSYLKKFTPEVMAIAPRLIQHVRLAKLQTIDDVRKILELRRRSREGVILPSKNRK